MNNYKCNLQPDSEDDRDIIFRCVEKQKDLPKFIDLRDKMPPIWDQQEIGSCQSFAFNRIFSYYNNNSFLPSHLFLYYNVRKSDGTIDDANAGGTLRGTIKQANKLGICADEFCPYITKNFNKEPTVKAYEDALKRISKNKFKYYRVTNSEEIYEAMTIGYIPFIGVRITASFYSDNCKTTGIIPYPNGRDYGGHALVISCGDLENRTFIIDNSWNTNIGNKGRFTVSFDVLDSLLIDAWAIDIDEV